MFVIRFSNTNLEADTFKTQFVIKHWAYSIESTINIVGGELYLCFLIMLSSMRSCLISILFGIVT